MYQFYKDPGFPELFPIDGMSLQSVPTDNHLSHASDSERSYSAEASDSDFKAGGVAWCGN
jgi:hypothetical protein